MFFDEKKNADGFNRKCRSDPVTGVVPPVLTQPNFRMIYKFLEMTDISEDHPLSFFIKYTLTAMIPLKCWNFYLYVLQTNSLLSGIS